MSVLLNVEHWSMAWGSCVFSLYDVTHLNRNLLSIESDFLVSENKLPESDGEWFY